MGRSQATTLGLASALMIVLGYPGELMLAELGTRWIFWAAAMIPFLYIVKTLLVGLNSATNSEEDPEVRRLVKRVQWWTVISWCTCLHFSHAWNQRQTCAGSYSVGILGVRYYLQVRCWLDDLPDYNGQDCGDQKRRKRRNPFVWLR